MFTEIVIYKQEAKSYIGRSGLKLVDGKYRENWNPDWQGDPNDPLRWKEW